MIGIEAVAVQTRTERPQTVPIEVASRTVPQAANDNFPVRKGLIERGTEKARSFVYERIANLPEGRLKSWCVNRAVNHYGNYIETAQKNADTASARLSALDSNNPAEMQKELKAQNDAVSKINQMAQWRSKYAGMLRGHFDGRLGKEENPKSPRGMAKSLETNVEKRKGDIDALTKALEDAKAELDVFTHAQAALVGKRAYGSPAEQAKSAETLGSLLKRIADSDKRLNAMVNVQQSESGQLDALRASNAKIAEALSYWSSVSENGRYGTNAAERPLTPLENKQQIVPSSVVEIASTSKQAALKETPSTTRSENVERASTLARAAELLLRELEFQELRDDLRDALKPIVGVDRVGDKIPPAALINLWNAYSKQDKIDKKSAQAIGEANKKGILLEDFAVEIADRTEVPKSKIIAGMENVARALKEKLETAEKAA